MQRILILDSFPLSCMGKASTAVPPTLTDQCREWVRQAVRMGYPVLVPAIVYYEVLRELHRLGATAQIRRLKDFVFSEPERFLPLKTEDLESAAILWAQTRNAGIQRASSDALDGDVLLCAQALSLGLPADVYVVATTNVSHLRPLVSAADWTLIGLTPAQDAD